MSTSPASTQYDFTDADDPRHVYARAAMAGFDDLPQTIRHMLNYSAASMLRPGECQRLCTLVRQHGAERVTALLAPLLDQAARDPNFCSRDRMQHR